MDNCNGAASSGNGESVFARDVEKSEMTEQDSLFLVVPRLAMESDMTDQNSFLLDKVISRLVKEDKVVPRLVKESEMTDDDSLLQIVARNVNESEMIEQDPLFLVVPRLVNADLDLLLPVSALERLSFGSTPWHGVDKIRSLVTQNVPRIVLLVSKGFLDNIEIFHLASRRSWIITNGDPRFQASRILSYNLEGWLLMRHTVQGSLYYFSILTAQYVNIPAVNFNFTIDTRAAFEGTPSNAANRLVLVILGVNMIHFAYYREEFRWSIHQIAYNVGIITGIEAIKMFQNRLYFLTSMVLFCCSEEGVLWEIRLLDLLDGFIIDFASIMIRGEEVLLVLVAEEQQEVQVRIYSVVEIGNQQVLQEVNNIGVGYCASPTCGSKFVPQPFEGSRIFFAGRVLDLVECVEFSEILAHFIETQSLEISLKAKALDHSNTRMS